jgi:hypothetical protein
MEPDKVEETSSAGDRSIDTTFERGRSRSVKTEQQLEPNREVEASNPSTPSKDKAKEKEHDTIPDNQDTFEDMGN